MFAARCVGVSLAVFILLYVFLSLAASRTWKWLFRIFRPHSARSAADLLFVFRILPVGLSSVFTLAVTVPSFLLLEPHSTDEAIGAVPTTLGLCCLILLAAGCIRAIAAQRRTSQAIAHWLNGSTVMESGGAVPVFRTGKDAPTFTVAGVCTPRVLVSEAAVATLTSSELRAALRHEMTHARRYDNLKKLLFRFVVFPGMSKLESAWSEHTEMAADDAAVSCFRDALDLAAALIKVSRLGPLESAELTTALLHSSTALSARIRRLFTWGHVQEPATHNRNWLYMLPAATGTTICLIATYGSMLTRMHTVTEWLVR